LLGGDRLDDEPVRGIRVERDFGPAQRLVHQCLNRWLVERRRRGEHDVPYQLAVASKDVRRIGEAPPLQEEQSDPSRIDNDRNDGLGGAFGWAEADGERVVVVVDKLERMGKAGAHTREDSFCPSGYLRVELRQESGQLKLG